MKKIDSLRKQYPASINDDVKMLLLAGKIGKPCRVCHWVRLFSFSAILNRAKAPPAKKDRLPERSPGTQFNFSFLLVICMRFSARFFFQTLPNAVSTLKEVSPKRVSDTGGTSFKCQKRQATSRWKCRLWPSSVCSRYFKPMCLLLSSTLTVAEMLHALRNLFSQK